MLKNLKQKKKSCESGTVVEETGRNQTGFYTHSKLDSSKLDEFQNWIHPKLNSKLDTSKLDSNPFQMVEAASHSVCVYLKLAGDFDPKSAM